MSEDFLKSLNVDSKECKTLVAVLCFAGGYVVYKWSIRRKLRNALLRKQHEARDTICSVKAKLLQDTHVFD